VNPNLLIRIPIDIDEHLDGKGQCLVMIGNLDMDKYFKWIIKWIYLKKATRKGG